MTRQFRYAVLVALVVGSVLVASPSNAGAQVIPTCDGKRATIIGTDGHDILIGTRFDDVIVGARGNDQIIGKGGQDTICAGPGSDVVRGGWGDDLIFGGDGADTIRGGPGADEIYGENGKDLIMGGLGRDGVFGGKGQDQLRGGPGADVVVGGPGRDGLRGGPHADELDGGDGRDLLNGGTGVDTCRNAARTSGCELGATPATTTTTAAPTTTTTTAAPTTTTTVPSRTNRMQFGAGDKLRSGNGDYELVMQGDGNLVLYRRGAGATALWSTRTDGNAGARAVMQGDGNLVVYASNNRVLWASNTDGGSASLVMQDDGNLVIYRSGRAVWASGTEQKATVRSLTVRLTENPFRCDNGVRPLGTVSGLDAGEVVVYSSPQLGGEFSRGRANGNGVASMQWQCSGGPKSWNVTIRGASSGSSVTFTVDGSKVGVTQDPILRQFAEARERYPKLGNAINQPHLWEGLWVQDFRARANSSDWNGSILIYNPRLGRVFAVRTGFWEHYINSNGPVRLGAPTRDEFDPDVGNGNPALTKVQSEQTFEKGSVWWIKDLTESFAASGDRVSQETTCTSKKFLKSITVEGVGSEIIFAIEPTGLARFPIPFSSDWNHAWNEWEDCLRRPNYLQPSQYDSLWQQLACHLKFDWSVLPLLPSSGTHFDLESWRRSIGGASTSFNGTGRTSSCNWNRIAP